MSNSDNALTLGVFHSYLTAEESRSAETLYNLLDHQALNALAQEKSLHSGTFRQAVKNQLAEIRQSKRYKKAMQSKADQPESLKVRVGRWVTRWFIKK